MSRLPDLPRAERTPAELARQVLVWALAIARHERRTDEEVMAATLEEGTRLIRERWEAQFALEALSVAELEAALRAVPA